MSHSRGCVARVSNLVGHTTLLSFCAMALSALIGTGTLHADDTSTTDTQVMIPQVLHEAQIKENELLAKEEQRKSDAIDRFEGWGFSAGIGLSVLFGEDGEISEATIVDSVVRVVNQNRAAARIMLESHYLFTRGADKMWGWGPFVSVLSSGDDLIDALGLGVMLGLRYSEDKANAFNLGVALAWDRDVQTLGDGLVENRPLPGGETAIRYRHDDALGALVMLSFKFE